jgi:hypothetical protein
LKCGHWRRMEIICNDRVNIEVLDRVKVERDIEYTKERYKANWIGHILRTDCLFKHIIWGRVDVTGTRGRRSWQLLDDLKETREYWKLKEEALDRSVWRTRFGRGCGHVVRQTAKWMRACVCVCVLVCARVFFCVLWGLCIKFFLSRLYPRGHRTVHYLYQWQFLFIETFQCIASGTVCFRISVSCGYCRIATQNSDICSCRTNFMKHHVFVSVYKQITRIMGFVIRLYNNLFMGRVIVSNPLSCLLFSYHPTCWINRRSVCCYIIS